MSTQRLSQRVSQRMSTRGPLAAIALSAATVVVVAGVVNAAIALVATQFGAEPSGPLMPIAYLTLTVVGAVAGAVGWRITGRRAGRPLSVMRWLVPSVLVVSWIPDLLLGLAFGTQRGWLTVAALMLMHLATIVIGVVAYSRLMPLATPGALRTASATRTPSGA